MTDGLDPVHPELTSQWFGRYSFIAAALGMFLNTVLFLTFLAYWAAYLLILPIELILIAILTLCGGRARHAGAGLALALLGSFLALTLGMVVV